MIKAIIVDDDEDCRKTLSHLIRSSFHQLDILAICISADEGKERIMELKPDLVFLDVEMPGKTGFDLLNELGEFAANFNVIFTTAHERFALKAIKASAVDFLLKPIGEDDLRQTLDKLDRKRNKEQASQQLQVLLEHYAKDNNPNKTIALPTLTGFIFVQIGDIIRCEADNVYSTFFMQNKVRLVVSKTLKDAEELLSDYGFFRVHNSHLINMMYIKEYVKGEGGIVKMKDGSEIEVSRRKKEDFLQKLKRL